MGHSVSTLMLELNKLSRELCSGIGVQYPWIEVKLPSANGSRARHLRWDTIILLCDGAQKGLDERFCIRSRSAWFPVGRVHDLNVVSWCK